MNRLSITKLNIIAIIFSAAIGVVTLLWMINTVPGYTEQERAVRGENAAMEKDIADIEAMEGATEAIEEKTGDVKDRINEKYSGRSTTNEAVAPLIKEICEKAGVDKVGIDIGSERILSPAGIFAPPLCMAQVNILFDGTEKNGSDVLAGLESSSAADFEVTAFVYSAIIFEEGEEDNEESEEDQQEAGAQATGQWIITATIYYYER